MTTTASERRYNAVALTYARDQLEAEGARVTEVTHTRRGWRISYVADDRARTLTAQAFAAWDETTARLAEAPGDPVYPALSA